jgi:hypothetical protein
MTAYIAFLIDIHDQAAFTGYARAAAPTYPVYGGGVALRGPIVDVLEGALEVSHDTRLVAGAGDHVRVGPDGRCTAPQRAVRGQPRSGIGSSPASPLEALR